MSLAYFSTWTTYGTWLPGDLRGWYLHGRGLQDPDAGRRFEALLHMTESALVLDQDQRRIVETTIAEHCSIRKWHLHAVNCRSNHVHVVVTAPDRPIELPREQFKSWCTRRLKERWRSRLKAVRDHWWSDRGWDEFIDDDASLANVVAYVMECQGPP
jgi:REP element-mobilizing transposase RayT